MIKKEEVLQWVRTRYLLGEFKFRAIPWDNTNKEYWFKDDENGITVFPGILPWIKDVHIKTVAGEKHYQAFKWGILEVMFDDLNKLEQDIKIKEMYALKEQMKPYQKNN